jgi:hypothetical protein
VAFIHQVAVDPLPSRGYEGGRWSDVRAVM